MEAKSSKTLRVREPETPIEVVEKIRQLREEYPKWGKDKLVFLLKRQGINIFASTVGRVINRLKKRGVLKEPVNATLVKLAKKRKWKPRYATRKPKNYLIKAPGDLVDVDTLTIKLLPNLVRYQFSAGAWLVSMMA